MFGSKRRLSSRKAAVLTVVVAVAVIPAAALAAPSAHARSSGTVEGIKLTLLTPKLTNRKLVVTSRNPVKLKFKVANTGNVALRSVSIELGPLAIVQRMYPAAQLAPDAGGGSVRWKIALLKVKRAKTFSATVQFDFRKQPYDSFALLTWGRYRSAFTADQHLQRVPVELKQP